MVAMGISVIVIVPPMVDHGPDHLSGSRQDARASLTSLKYQVLGRRSVY
jgi:hypothetical protein